LYQLKRKSCKPATRGEGKKKNANLSKAREGKGKSCAIIQKEGSSGGPREKRKRRNFTLLWGVEGIPQRGKRKRKPNFLEEMRGGGGTPCKK